MIIHYLRSVEQGWGGVGVSCDGVEENGIGNLKCCYVIVGKGSIEKMPVEGNDELMVEILLDCFSIPDDR